MRVDQILIAPRLGGVIAADVGDAEAGQSIVAELLLGDGQHAEAARRAGLLEKVDHVVTALLERVRRAWSDHG